MKSPTYVPNALQRVDPVPEKKLIRFEVSVYMNPRLNRMFQTRSERENYLLYAAA
jgi:hypothetical protein